jgi:hypothetical protein
MFQTTFFTALGAIVGAASSIMLMPFVKSLKPEFQLATAALLGAVCSSVLVCREKSIQKKLSKDAGAKNKGALSNIRKVLFWLVLFGGLAAVAVAGYRIFG